MLDTPQFNWALNRLSKKPQPAPQIFTPEVAARAVMKAVETIRREYLVGKSVIKLVRGNMVLPDWLDRKMADAGAMMQKSDVEDSGGRPDILEGPVEDMPATASGAFTKKASDSALLVDADRLRQAVFLEGPALLFGLGLLLG